MATRRVVIVGGVAGGAACAARLRRLDESCEIIMFERSPHVSFANCGLPYHVGDVVDHEENLVIVTPHYFEVEFNVRVFASTEVTGVDSSSKVLTYTRLTNGETESMAYDELVLAPGAKPIKPNLPGLNLPGVFTVRNIPDARDIRAFLASRPAPRRAVVVGAGFIGLEMAENLRKQLLDVTLVDIADQVLPVVDREMTFWLHEELEKAGVRMVLGDGLARVEEGKVITQSNKEIAADIIIMAIGVTPENVLAKMAGCKIGKRGGIIVTEHLHSSIPSIWAVGDAIEVKHQVTGLNTQVPLAGPAARQGRLVAENITSSWRNGRQRVYPGTKGSAVIGAFGVTIGSVGCTEKELNRIGISDYHVLFHHANQHAGYYPLAHKIHSKLIYQSDGRILGFQASGRCEGVDKRVDVVSMCMQKSGTVYDLENAELCYAPQFNSARDPINLLAMSATHVLEGVSKPLSWLEAIAIPNAYFIDVRYDWEFTAGHIPGVQSIPSDKIRAKIKELPTDRPIILSCAIGRAAYFAEQFLRHHRPGQQICHISGGFESFRAQKFAHADVRDWAEKKDMQVLNDKKEKCLVQRDAKRRRVEADVGELGQPHMPLPQRREIFDKHFPNYGFDGRIENLRRDDFPNLLQVAQLQNGDKIGSEGLGDCYLDSTGASIYPRSLIAEVKAELESRTFGNPHSDNPSSSAATKMVDAAREDILRHFNVTEETHCVLFTSNCTAALKLVAENFPWTPCSEFRYLSQNHNSVLGMREYASRDGAQVSMAAPCDPLNPARVIVNKNIEKKNPDCSGQVFHLFAYPGECNFTGRKYSLEWPELYRAGKAKVSEGSDPTARWLVLLDAAALVPTSNLDLSKVDADFVSMSFYKMFGYPTGLGALVAKRESIELLRKRYWGGGSVAVTLSGEDYKTLRKNPVERYEDGTISFLSIGAVRHGLKILHRLGFDNIKAHTHTLTQYLFKRLTSLRHSNGTDVCHVVGNHTNNDANVQGPIVNCSFISHEGNYIGYNTISNICTKHNIHIRVGCFCNPGACHISLSMSPDDVKRNQKAGHTCGGKMDIDEMNKPLGSVRISVGYMNTFEDIEQLMCVIEDHVIDKTF